MSSQAAGRARAHRRSTSQTALAGQNTRGPAGTRRDRRALGAHRRRGRSPDPSRTSASCASASARRRSGSATSPTVTRGLEDPPTRKTRYQGKDAVMHRRRHGQRLQRHRGRRRGRRGPAKRDRARSAARRRARPDLRPAAGRQQCRSANSCEALGEALADRARRLASCRSAGAPGSSSRSTIPLVLAATFLVMYDDAASTCSASRSAR